MILSMALLGYVAVWAYTVRAFALRNIDQVAQDELRGRNREAASFRPEDRDHFLADKGPLVDDFQRQDARWGGIGIGAIWPVYWAGRFGDALFSRVNLQSPTELAERQRRELEALRRLAREHNLPLPEADRR